MELKITISAPDLSAALTELAKAVGSRPAGLLADATGTAAQQAAAREPEAYQSPGGHAGEMKQQPEPVLAALPEPVQAPVPAAMAPMPAIPTPAALAPMPAIPAPVPVTTTPAQIPAPAAAPVPVIPTPAAVAPAPMPVPAATMPVQAPPSAPAKAVSLQQIARAGAALVDQGKKAEVIGALRRYGVQAVTQLRPEQFAQFAGELRALGAQI